MGLLTESDPEDARGYSSDSTRRPDPSELRNRAEQMAKALSSGDIDILSPEEIRRVIHELRVHQIELEMQNEGLRVSREELEASRARYFDLYDRAPVGYCTLTKEGVILEANLTAGTLLGVARSVLVKGPLTRFIFPEDQDAYYFYFLRKQLPEIPFAGSREADQPWVCELRMVREGGGVFWARLEAADTRDEDGTPVRRVVISDISEHKRAEEERAAYAKMVDQRNLLDALMESLPVGLALLDAHGETMRANPEFERIWGTPRPVDTSFGNHAVYRGRWATSGQPVRPEDWASARALQKGETTVGQELVIQRFDGKQAFVLNSAAPIRDAHGAIAGCSVAIMDVTELKAAERQFREAQKLESLGVLAGGIAHDFNNLVGGILANSELAEQKLASGSPADEEIRNIKKVAGRAAEIVRQMMAYAGREAAVLESVDLSGLVGDILQLLQISISKRVALKMDLKEDLPAVLANPGQMRQVVMNLVTNASEAIGESNGVITISTSEARAEGGSPQSILGLGQRGGVRLEVSDTGCGMTEEIRSRIFDPFFTTKFAGRGLGLAAVHGIVRSHGGVINVTSAPGRGSRFEVLLPRAGQPAREAGDSAAPAANEGGSFTGTILVVEDEAELRNALCEMLRRNGCTVIEAADGQTAIDHFQTSANRIDVVLLDLTLPGMSGKEVLGELRRIQPDVKVILTSAYSLDLALDKADGQKPWLYIRKPYLFSQLMALIRESGRTTDCSQAGG